MSDNQNEVLVKTICSALSCDSAQFKEWLENPAYNTEILVDDAKEEIITLMADDLDRASTGRCNLRRMLICMLDYALHESGRKYVAIALHIAAKKGPAAVIQLANVWVEHLFFPARIRSTEPSSSQIPEYEDTAASIEGTTRSEQRRLREAVAKRENHRCAITKLVDDNIVPFLSEEEWESLDITTDPKSAPMDVAHIIPFSLNNFNEKDGLSVQLRNAAYTFRAWTSLDIDKLVGSRINDPANAIYMTNTEHRRFGRFAFYFDGEAYPNNPNKYQVKMFGDRITLSTGHKTAVVEFPTFQQSSVNPPDPEFLSIHAAFAKVLHLSGMVQYFEKIERDAEGTLLSNGETDVGAILTSRLMVLAW